MDKRERTRMICGKAMSVTLFFLDNYWCLWLLTNVLESLQMIVSLNSSSFSYSYSVGPTCISHFLFYCSQYQYTASSVENEQVYMQECVLLSHQHHLQGQINSGSYLCCLQIYLKLNLMNNENSSYGSN